MTFPVDVVYTWVDGNDENHIAMRASANNAGVHHTSTAPMRWRSHGELQQSIFSIQTFAPWVRYIFIVTSLGQRPDLLPSKQVVIIDDQTLFETAGMSHHLPVFNSHAIEAHLHRIPGLADHFLYFCDDMFLGAPVVREDFFPAWNRSVHIPGGVLPRHDRQFNGTAEQQPGWFTARCNNSRVLDKEFGSSERQACAHQVRPLLKWIMAAMWAHPEWGPMLENTSAAKFRHNTDLEPVGLAAQIALSIGCAHTQTERPRVLRMYFALRDGRDPAPDFHRLLKNRPDVYCINDDLKHPTEQYLRQVRKMFQRSLPHHRHQPSP